MSNSESDESLMPAIFIGHGSPMNAIEDNEFSQAWRRLGEKMPRPEAIICISAHWMSKGSRVNASANPSTIPDFYGFPRELYEINYSAPGAPDLAEKLKNQINMTEIELDRNRGFDHGTWIVLKQMYPNADIPTMQLSLDYTKPPSYHYRLGKELKELRKKGILLIGSGNIVHNLGIRTPTISYKYDWAIEFDEMIKEFILKYDYESIIEYEKYGDLARLEIPTNEHYLPLLYVLAVQNEKDKISFSCEKIIYGSISMRCVIFN